MAAPAYPSADDLARAVEENGAEFLLALGRGRDLLCVHGAAGAAPGHRRGHHARGAARCVRSRLPYRRARRLRDGLLGLSAPGLPRVLPDRHLRVADMSEEFQMI